MPKRTFLAGIMLIAVFLLIPTLNAQTLKLKITNIQKAGGKVMVAIYNEESGWMDAPFQVSSLDTKKDNEIISFEVPYGTYAVSVYQDVNGNDKMDTNFMNIPKEPIAFGNNYKPFGKPKFKSAAIRFDNEYQVQTLELYTIL